jgi:hypothetical protein
MQGKAPPLRSGARDKTRVAFGFLFWDCATVENKISAPTKRGGLQTTLNSTSTWGHLIVTP